MSQNLEIEFKNMLTKDEYIRLSDHLGLNNSGVFTQENHYFDTRDFALKDKGCALRIRQKNNRYEMTLKQPVEEGLLETNQELSEDEAQAAFRSEGLPSGEVEALIESMGISLLNLEYFGSLTTRRAEVKYGDGLLVIDYSTYLNTEDYELEYEVGDYGKGKAAFVKLLNDLGIPERKTNNKIRRFYEQKYKSRD